MSLPNPRRIDELASPQGGERSLDPEDWESMRELGHRMVDDMLDYLRDVRTRPVWQPVPDAVQARLRHQAPRHGQSPESIYQEFQELVLPYALGNIHPRFWGWVIGTGTPLGMLAELLAGAMNPNVGSANQAALYVERQVIDWCKEMLGYPSDASGVLLSGGSMANFVSLAVARHARAGFDVNADGLSGRPRLMLYGSTETHNSVHKSARLLGLGLASFREIPVTDRFEVDVPALEAAIAADRHAGHRPFCVVGNAGTVNTGATDDLDRLADICAAEALWFHVDGAFGALAALTRCRSILRGLERADSVAFDLHKWMYMQYDVGCALVRHPDAHLATFAAPGGYLGRTDGGIASGGHWFSELTPELSRCFRALKVWMSIKEHGLDRFGEQIQQNIDQAAYLAGLVEASEGLELAAPVPLNIVCFRYRDERLAPDELDRLNERILVALQEQGIAAPSFTRIHGRFVIRVAISNHRSRRDDFDVLVREVTRLGVELTQDA